MVSRDLLSCLRLCSCVLALLLFAFPASAEDRWEILDSKFVVKLGAMWHEVDAEVATTGPLGNPRGVDLDKLGVDDTQTVFWASARWNFAKRWHVKGVYTTFEQSGSRTISDSIDFGKISFPVGVSVDTDLATDFYIVNAGYKLLDRPRGDIDIGLGLHVVDIDFEIAGLAAIGDEPVSFKQSKLDTLAPLPNVMMSGRFAITRNLALEGDVGWFGLDVDKYDGELTSARVNLEWRPFEHLGFGVGYQLLDLDLEVDGDRRDKVFDFDFKGPLGFVQWAF